MLNNSFFLNEASVSLVAVSVQKKELLVNLCDQPGWQWLVIAASDELTVRDLIPSEGHFLIETSPSGLSALQVSEVVVAYHVNDRRHNGVSFCRCPRRWL